MTRPMIASGSESKHQTPRYSALSSYSTRNSVRSVIGAPSSGSCCRKSPATGARSQVASSSTPSITGDCSTRSGLMDGRGLVSVLAGLSAAKAKPMKPARAAPRQNSFFIQGGLSRLRIAAAPRDARDCRCIQEKQAQPVRTPLGQALGRRGKPRMNTKQRTLR